MNPRLEDEPGRAGARRREVANSPEEIEALARALERLPVPYRQALNWRGRERRSFEEMGRLLDQSPDAARNLWFSALDSLSQQFQHEPDAAELPRESEEQLASWVSAYEQALSSGVPFQAPPDGEASPALVSRFQRVVACLQRLERVWSAGNSSDGASGDAPTVPEPPSGKTATTPFHVPGYVLLGEIGHGGMGVVFRARQLNLNRDVALKRLTPALAADPTRLERFRNEARAAAQVVDGRVVPVFDIVELADGPVLVMPFIEGRDLGRILSDRSALCAGEKRANPHPWASLDERAYLDRVLPLIDTVLAAVTAVHRAGILHRDIKPSNILVENNDSVWLSDFGLARLGSESGLTCPGVGVGTPGYMSPEQWEGLEKVDARTDVFGVGVSVYKVLTLELPYGTARLNPQTPAPVPPGKLQPMLPRDFDTVLRKALEPEREDRYPSIQAFQEDWLRVRQGLPPHGRRRGRLSRLGRTLRRNPATVAAVLLAAVALSLLAAAWQLRFALPPPAPGDLAVVPKVFVTTEPPGAHVALVPLDPVSGEPQPSRARRPVEKTPVALSGVAVGEYLVVANVAGHGFHEVYREVPAADRITGHPGAPQLSWVRRPDGTVELPTIKVPRGDVTEGMVRFDGGEFTVGTDELQGVSPHRTKVPAFYLDPTEVTVGEYRKVTKSLPGRAAEKPPPDADAMSGVTFDRAVDYAERVGKRLPDESEYEFAATEGGTREYPRDVAGVWTFGLVGPGERGGATPKAAVFGLYGNVAEWTNSRNYPYPGSPDFVFAHRRAPEMRAILDQDRIVRGGPHSVIVGQPDAAEIARGPRWREGISRTASHPGLGFRCARSAKPRFLDP